MKCQVVPPTPAILPLKVNDLLFVDAYLSNGRSAVQAYKVAHPKVLYSTCRVEAYRILAKPSVKAEIARRVQHEGGITREFVQSNLLTALHLANDAKDAAVIASISMDCAKLAGFLIEKHQDVTPPPDLTPSELQTEYQRRCAPLSVDVN